MYETASAKELAELLENPSPAGAEWVSIDRVSALLLRALIAERYPDAAELYMDWDQSGLSCGSLRGADGAVIEDFDPFDETYPECLLSLASNIRQIGDLQDVLVGPANGPLMLKFDRDTHTA